jgi:transposase
MALFPPGKGGGQGVDYGYKGKGVLIHLIVDKNGAPLSIDTGPANEDERLFLEPLLDILPKKPKVLCADKGYDAKYLRDIIKYMGIKDKISYRNYPTKGAEYISKNHRWVVERTFAWFQLKFKRLVIRWERKMKVWSGFVDLALIFWWVQKIVG